MNTLVSLSERKQCDLVVNVKLSVSKGEQLDFAVDGKPVSGIVLSSKIAEQAQFVRVAVETKSEIPDNARLSIPTTPEAGTCGRAFAIRQRSGVKLVLYIRCSCVDAAS